MLDVAVRERGDVDQAVDTREQLDEGAEGLQPHDLPRDPLSLLQLGPRGVPRILLERAEGERDALVALLVRLHAQDLHAHLLPLLDDVLGMRDAGVAHLGDVDESLEPAQIDEGAEVAHRGDRAVEHRTDLQLLA